MICKNALFLLLVTIAPQKALTHKMVNLDLNIKYKASHANDLIQADLHNDEDVIQLADIADKNGHISAQEGDLAESKSIWGFLGDAVDKA